MKKSELKAVLKPIIEECLRESIVDNGFLGKLITEVISATHQAGLVVETRSNEKAVFGDLLLSPAKTPKKDTPRVKRALELESAGYFEGITVPQVAEMAAATSQSSTGIVVEGVGQVKTDMDNFLDSPGMSEDMIKALMNGMKP